MFKTIPFYKKFKICNISKLGNTYIIKRYHNNSSIITEERIPVSRMSTNAINYEYNETLLEYLNDQNSKYKESLKNIKKNFEYKHRINKLLLSLGLIGIFLPFMGLALQNIMLLYLGIPTLFLGIPGAIVSINNIKTNKINIESKNFVQNYEELKKYYTDNMVPKKSVQTKGTIELIHGAYGVDLTRKKRI